MSWAVSLVLLSPSAWAQQTPTPDPGAVGNPDSWRTKEFEADWGLAAMNTQFAYARGLNGNGITLGHYDSGVALDNPEFAGKPHLSLTLKSDACAFTDSQVPLAGPGSCFISEGNRPAVTVVRRFYNDGAETITAEIGGGSHGTHVAGTMVANRNGVGMHGTAFAARLVTARYYPHSLKTSTQDAAGNWTSNTEYGPGDTDPALVNQLYAQMVQQGVKLVNFEMWSPIPADIPADQRAAYLITDYKAQQAKLDAMVDGAIKYDLLTVHAAGNGNGDIANVFPSMPIIRPEAEPYWLTVVNTNEQGKISPTSSICAQTKQWCVAAPGTNIQSVVTDGGVSATLRKDPATGAVQGFDLTYTTPTFNYEAWTGTSMAEPHAVGALALLQERFPYLRPTQLRDVLLTTATDLGEAGVDDIYGWGLINLQKAIEGPGQLRVNMDVNMNQAAGGAKVWEGDAWDNWSNDIGGPGYLSKSGPGWLRLSGNNRFAGAIVKDGVLELTGSNQFSGAVDVQGGRWLSSGTLRDSQVNVHGGTALLQGQMLGGSMNVAGGLWRLDGHTQDTQVDLTGGVADVQGSMQGGSLTVGAAARLLGNGTVASTLMAGTIAPNGDAIGTLTVQGDYTQKAGSVFEANVQAPDQADALLVQGRAMLEGGTLRVFASPGQYLLGQQYALLSASQGVEGQFAELQADPQRPFLAWALRYLPSQVWLDVSRGQMLATAAQTRNQLAVGNAADALPMQSGLLGALTQLRWDQAPDALDSLSGELHASTQTALLQAGAMVRDVALDRARFSQDAFTRQIAGADGVWVDVRQSSNGLHDKSGNAGDARHSASAQILGYDHAFASGTSLGILGGLGKGDVRVSKEAARSEIQSRYWGLYAGQRWGSLGLRAGWVQGTHEVTSQREIHIGESRQNAHASHQVRTQQAFMEGGYEWQWDRWKLEPYLQWAQLNQRSAAFNESGGIGALQVSSAHQRANVYTGGVRFNVDVGPGLSATWLNFYGGLAYRRAHGDLDSNLRAQWEGSPVFTAYGVPMAGSSRLMELGVQARPSPRTLLELGYSGQFTGDSHDHGLNARFALQF